MAFPRLVIPPSRELLQTFTGHGVAVRVAAPAQALAAEKEVRDSGNRLVCVIVDSENSLEELELPLELKTIPLALLLPSAGKLRNYSRLLGPLREFNLRVHLHCHGPENLTNLRILSSLGVATCAMFGCVGAMGEEDWEELTDLMTYALLEPSSHAPMEPFAFLAGRAECSDFVEWGGTFFDEPSRYLHLDATGRVALTAAELKGGRFIADSIEELLHLEDPREYPLFRERTESWRWFFAQNHPCAACGGWKPCRGRFSDGIPPDRGCETFFKELLDAIPRSRSRNLQAEERVWQP